MCSTFHPSAAQMTKCHKEPLECFPQGRDNDISPRLTVGQGHPDCAEPEVGAVRQSQGRWGWLLLTLHCTSESLHAFLFHICTEVFHISGWIFREAFQNLIQLALQMDLEENTWGLARLKLFCQHLLWAFPGLQSGISALAREKGMCKFTPMQVCSNPQKDNFRSCPSTAQGKWWPQLHRCKAALGPRAAAAEPDFPCTFTSGISKAAEELDAGDVNIDRIMWVFSASLLLALPG